MDKASLLTTKNILQKYANFPAWYFQEKADGKFYRGRVLKKDSRKGYLVVNFQRDNMRYFIKEDDIRQFMIDYPDVHLDPKYTMDGENESFEDLPKDDNRPRAFNSQQISVDNPKEPQDGSPSTGSKRSRRRRKQKRSDMEADQISREQESGHSHKIPKLPVTQTEKLDVAQEPQPVDNQPMEVDDCIEGVENKTGSGQPQRSGLTIGISGPNDLSKMGAISHQKTKDPGVRESKRHRGTSTGTGAAQMSINNNLGSNKKQVSKKDTDQGDGNANVQRDVSTSTQNRPQVGGLQHYIQDLERVVGSSKDQGSLFLNKEDKDNNQSQVVTNGVGQVKVGNQLSIQGQNNASLNATTTTRRQIKPTDKITTNFKGKNFTYKITEKPNFKITKSMGEEHRRVKSSEKVNTSKANQGVSFSKQGKNNFGKNQVIYSFSPAKSKTHQPESQNKTPPTTTDAKAGNPSNAGNIGEIQLGSAEQNSQNLVLQQNLTKINQQIQNQISTIQQQGDGEPGTSEVSYKDILEGIQKRYNAANMQEIQRLQQEGLKQVQDHNEKEAPMLVANLISNLNKTQENLSRMTSMFGKSEGMDQIAEQVQQSDLNESYPQLSLLVKEFMSGQQEEPKCSNEDLIQKFYQFTANKFSGLDSSSASSNQTKYLQSLLPSLTLASQTSSINTYQFQQNGDLVVQNVHKLLQQLHQNPGPNNLTPFLGTSSGEAGAALQNSAGQISGSEGHTTIQNIQIPNISLKSNVLGSNSSMQVPSLGIPTLQNPFNLQQSLQANQQLQNLQNNLLMQQQQQSMQQQLNQQIIQQLQNSINSNQFLHNITQVSNINCVNLGDNNYFNNNPLQPQIVRIPNSLAGSQLSNFYYQDLFKLGAQNAQIYYVDQPSNQQKQVDQRPSAYLMMPLYNTA